MLRRNVLIFHLGALGDFVLSWPLALALGRVYAQSRIIFVTHSQKGALAEKALRLESTDIEGGWHALFSANAELPPRAASLLSDAHAIYTFLPPSAEWIANVNRINPQAKIVAIQSRAPEGFSGHTSDWLVRQLREHAIERAATEQMLRSIAERGIGFNRTAGDDIVIHPGSGSPAKCWPIESFVALAERLRADGRAARFIVGEVERERLSSSQLNALAAAGRVRQPQTYVELLAELSSASMFIGNDSGPGHLAGMIGVPTVAIFGPTEPATWKPLGPRVSVVSGTTMAGVSVDAVLAAKLSE